MKSLEDLQKSPERMIVEAAAAILHGDEILADVFKPIRILDTPSREAFLSYGVNSMVIQPISLKAEDHPSGRTTSFLGVLISAYLAPEPREEESELQSLDLGNHLRKLFWGTDLQSAGDALTYATTAIKLMPPLSGVNGSTRILSYLLTFETDVDPKTGLFEPV